MARQRPKKRKKPSFKRPESSRYVRVKPSWRRPKGLDNKVREKRKGWTRSPNIGYRNPSATRGLHPTGLVDVLVHNPADLDGLNPEIHGVRVAHTVGFRKRLSIRDKADELGILIFNPLKESLEFEEYRYQTPKEQLKKQLESMEDDYKGLESKLKTIEKTETKKSLAKERRALKQQLKSMDADYKKLQAKLKTMEKRETKKPQKKEEKKRTAKKEKPKKTTTKKSTKPKVKKKASK